MAVSQAFDTPLERLGLLPNGMNWRGDWDVAEQYFLNDVVRSPANLSSYILNGRDALRGGVDPTLNPDWVELSSATTGVIQVNAGAGITIAGTATVPVVENDGILSITAGNAGITVVGGAGAPPLNAVISNSGVLGITNGLGINVTGTAQQPIINNNGVRTLTAGAGMVVNNADPNNPVVVNGGVTSIVDGGAGITITNPTGPAVTITNDGVLSVTAGTGISVTGTAQNPVINSSAVSPILSRFVFSNIPIGSLPQNLPATGSYNFIFGNFGFFATSFATGTADPNGCWVVDLSGIVFQNLSGSAMSSSASFTFQVQDNSGAVYTIDPFVDGGEVLVAYPNTTVVTLPRMVFPLSTMRSAGITNPKYFIINNGGDQDFKITAISTTFFPIYYPNGIQ